MSEDLAAAPVWLSDSVWLALGCLVLVLVLAMLSRRDGTQRQIAGRIERVRAGDTAGKAASNILRAGSVRKAEAPTVLGGLGSLLSGLVPRQSALRARLDRAGMSLAVTDFALISLAVGLVLAVIIHWRFGLSPLMAGCIGVMAALWLPGAYLRRRIRRRELAFLASFPDALDLVVRGVRSGLPVTEALNTIGREMPQPMAGLFTELCANMQIGISLGEALAIAGRKMDVPEFRFFTISLVVQQETGGNLAEILQNLSGLLRRRHQMRLKIKAMSSEARASAMIIGALPFLTGFFIYLINPEYMGKLFTDPRGMIMLGCAVASMGTGLGVMSKMVRFEI